MMASYLERFTRRLISRDYEPCTSRLDRYDPAAVWADRIGGSIVADVPTCCGEPVSYIRTPRIAGPPIIEAVCLECADVSCEDCGGPVEWEYEGSSEYGHWVCERRCTDGDDDSRRDDR